MLLEGRLTNVMSNCYTENFKEELTFNARLFCKVSIFFFYFYSTWSIKYLAQSSTKQNVLAASAIFIAQKYLYHN